METKETMYREKTVTIEKIDGAADIFGDLDGNIKAVEAAFGVTVVYRDGAIKITGDNADLAGQAIKLLDMRLKNGNGTDSAGLSYVISMLKKGKAGELKKLTEFVEPICITAHGKPVKVKTIGQMRYIEAIDNSTITFGVGPAGTGKTYLAVALAVDAYKKRHCKKIILTRPAVEAGEQLGFLPGDLQQKIDPYLRPLYDAVFDMLDGEDFTRMREHGEIEVVPLAYMRGRTLNDSFIILDEAQNTTSGQMKMFLTRLGSNSKAVITGDLTQTDLPDRYKSGLKEAVGLLRGIDDISVVYLDESDVVRNSLVRKIIGAYERGNHTEKGSGNID